MILDIYPVILKDIIYLFLSSELIAHRLKKAKKLGADFTMDAKEDIPKKIVVGINCFSLITKS